MTPKQSWLHWMNDNALRVEMGIPLLAHPKHTYSKIGGLTDSDPEYSSDPEVELDDLIQYSKEVESNSTKNLKSDQDSPPNLVIYATPQGWTLHWKETQDPKALSSQPPDLPFQQSTPLDPTASKQDQEIQDLCREILMVRISEVHEPEDDSTELSISTTTILTTSTSTFLTKWKLLPPRSQKLKLPPSKIRLHLLHL